MVQRAAGPRQPLISRLVGRDLRASLICVKWRFVVSCGGYGCASSSNELHHSWGRLPNLLGEQLITSHSHNLTANVLKAMAVTEETPALS